MPFAPNGDIEIFYETFGDPGAEPLLLVNGLGSQSINYRDAWCERFVAAGFFVIRFDNRGLGLSGPDSPDEAGYTLSDMALDGLAVLDALGIDQANVMGVSLGGMVVQTMAIDHPERLRSLTSVMSTTGDPDVGQASDKARERLFAKPARSRDEYVAGHLAGLRIWGSPGKVDEVEHTAAAGRAYDRAFRPEGVAAQMGAVIAGGSRTEALGRVEVPTLVIHGSADQLIDPSGGRRTADAIPGARFVEIEGMGHDYPEVFWDRWVGLVAEHALGRADEPVAP
jgi:pimeloyl-ACP methyl ester carboxylesterase